MEYTEDLESMSGAELSAYVDRVFNDQRITTMATVNAILQPVVEEMNRRGRAIAKKYNRRYRNLTVRDLTFNRDAQMARLAQ